MTEGYIIQNSFSIPIDDIMKDFSYYDKDKIFSIYEKFHNNFKRKFKTNVPIYNYNYQKLHSIIIVLLHPELPQPKITKNSIKWENKKNILEFTVINDYDLPIKISFINKVKNITEEVMLVPQSPIIWKRIKKYLGKMFNFKYPIGEAYEPLGNSINSLYNTRITDLINTRTQMLLMGIPKNIDLTH